ncbi:MAG: hypothetical protein H6Q16_1520 [Bacteroidetes bacterium]|nr:hypothetical protein [Bacteroidota bacterium]
MKLLIILLLTVSLIIVSKPSKSQIISPYNIISGAYEINASESVVDYTQKILKYKDRYHIVLTKLEGSKRNIFYLIEQDKYLPIFADISDELKVKDFSIMGDSIYLCGYMNKVDEYFKGSTQGFIAYVSITDLFNNTGNIQYNYSRVPTTTVVNKIKTYHNSRGERMVVGIGKQLYSAPPYECPVAYDPNPLKIDPNPDPDCWVYPDTNYFDCFIGYKITETILNPAFPSVNSFSLYRHEFTPDDDDTIDRYKYEEFQDLAITDNYICLASTYLFDPSITGLISHSKFIVLRKFDKNDFNNHTSNRINLSSSDISHAEYGFRLEALDKDNVAIAHVACEYPMGDQIRTIVTKVNLDEEPCQFIHSSLVDSDIKQINMQDIEYIPEIDHLLLLKEKDIYGINNILYYVDMYENIYPTATFGNYITNYLYVPQEIFSYQKWNNILRYDKTNFALIGNVGTKLGLLDNETNNFLTNQCRKYDIKTIHQREINIFTQFDSLFQCSFALMYPYAPGFYYYGNTTIIHKMDLMIPRVEKIEVKCLKKSDN